MDIEVKSTLVVFRKELLDERLQLGANLIACGSSRGGTSSLGVLMRHFGFNMGDNLHEFTHEDFSFVEAVEEENVDKIIDLIKLKNDQNNAWCLKLPAALTLLPIFDQHAAQPVFLIVIRNPFAIARSLVARDERFCRGLLEDYMAGIQHADIFLHGLLELQNVKAPAIICEYEKILASPEVFVNEFIEVLHIKPAMETTALAVALVSEPEYKSVSSAPAAQTT